MRRARSEYSVQVEVAPIESAHALDRQWDVIVLAAVLEHVYEPARLLQRVAAALRPGGVVYIDVPNECALYNRLGNLYMWLRGRDWATNLSPTFSPFHVVGFCPQSLRRVLAAAGLKPVVMEQYRMRSYFEPAGVGLRALAERLGVEATLALGQLVGMGAGLLYWARKA
jgi:SAM-dependent methyltransferase